jgi:hypothetical protein
MEAFLKSTTDPYFDGTVEYGDRQPHCWCGGEGLSLPVSMLTINQRFAPEMAARMIKTAPRGALVTTWLYQTQPRARISSFCRRWCFRGGPPGYWGKSWPGKIRRFQRGVLLVISSPP